MHGNGSVRDWPGTQGRPSTVLAEPAMKDNTPGAKAPTTDGNDSEAQTDGGTRRRFLEAGAAAAALSSIPFVGPSEAAQTDSTEEKQGEKMRDFTGSLWASMSLERSDEATRYRVEAYPKDPNAQVSVDFSGDIGQFSICLTSEKANELAYQLRKAALEGER